MSLPHGHGKHALPGAPSSGNEIARSFETTDPMHYPRNDPGQNIAETAVIG